MIELTTHNKGSLLKLGNMSIIFLKKEPFYFEAPGIGHISNYNYDSSINKRVLDYFLIKPGLNSRITGGKPFNELLNFCITQSIHKDDVAAHNNKAKLSSMIEENKKARTIFMTFEPSKFLVHDEIL